MNELINRFRKTDPQAKLATVFFTTAAILYGGTKPPAISADDTGEEQIMFAAEGLEESGESQIMFAALYADDESTALELSLSTQTFAVSNWTARGAYSDWEHVNLPDDIVFGYGLDRLTNLTLFANGEIRRGLRGETLASLPEPVSIEPSVSSVVHGLTASNTYLLVWNDALIRRVATNRTDAAIELFPDGSVAVTTKSVPIEENESSQISGQTTTIPPPSPAGYHGIGQDETWIASNLTQFAALDSAPVDAAQIIAAGYDNYVADLVGVDEMNGIYEVAVTIPALSTEHSALSTNLYLECGPYKMRLAGAGTYRFPLKVFESCHIMTRPVRVPFSLAFNDGYTGSGESLEIDYSLAVTNETEVDSRDSSILRFNSSVSLLAAAQEDAVKPNLVECYFTGNPKLMVAPNRIRINEDTIHEIELYYNAHPVNWMYETLVEDFTCVFGSSNAFIRCMNEGTVKIIGKALLGSEYENLYLYLDPDTMPTNRANFNIFAGETLHYNQSSNRLYITATTRSANGVDYTINLGTNESYTVDVMLATAEIIEKASGWCNDSYSWSITANGEIYSGSGTLSQHRSGLIEARAAPVCYVYGQTYQPTLLTSFTISQINNGAQTINVAARTENAVDDLRETCLIVFIR